MNTRTAIHHYLQNHGWNQINVTRDADSEIIYGSYWKRPKDKLLFDNIEYNIAILTDVLTITILDKMNPHQRHLPNGLVANTVTRLSYHDATLFDIIDALQ